MSSPPPEGSNRTEAHLNPPDTKSVAGPARHARRTAPPITYTSGMYVPDRSSIWPIDESKAPSEGVVPSSSRVNEGVSLDPLSISTAANDEITPAALTHPVAQSFQSHSVVQPLQSGPPTRTAESGSRRSSLHSWLTWPVKLSNSNFRCRQSSATTAVQSFRLSIFPGNKPSNASQKRRADSEEAEEGEDKNNGLWQTPSPGLTRKWSTKQKFHAVMALVAAFCQQWLCCGLVMGYGAVLAFFKLQVIPSTSLSVLTLIGGIPPFIILFSSIFLGRVVDAGYHRWLNGIGCILILIGLVGMTFSVHFDDGAGGGSAWHLALSVILLGIGQACLFLNSSHCAATWFPYHRGLATGFTGSGAAVGGFLFPLMFKTLASKRDYQFSMWMVFTVSVALSIVINVFGRPCPTFERRALRQVWKLGTWIPFCAFKSKAMILQICAMICIYSGILVTPFFLQYWADEKRLAYVQDIFKHTGQDIGQSHNRDVYLTCLLNGMQLSGRLLGPILSDTLSARHIHSISAVLSSLTLLFWLFASNFAIAAIFCAIFGQLTGLMVSLPVSDVTDILGSRHVSRLSGHYAGLMYTCASPFIMVGPIVASVLIEKVGLEVAAYWVMGCFLLGAVFLELGCRSTGVRSEHDHGGNGCRIEEV